MRCYCCNKLLSSREATRKFKESQEFVDMCDECVNETFESPEMTEGYQEEEEENE